MPAKSANSANTPRRCWQTTLLSRISTYVGGYKQVGLHLTLRPGSHPFPHILSTILRLGSLILFPVGRRTPKTWPIGRLVWWMTSQRSRKWCRDPLRGAFDINGTHAIVQYCAEIRYLPCHALPRLHADTLWRTSATLFGESVVSSMNNTCEHVVFAGSWWVCQLSELLLLKRKLWRILEQHEHDKVWFPAVATTVRPP